MLPRSLVLPFWKEFLLSIGATKVVDLSPGSASLARACLDVGIPILCWTRSESHGKWLANVLDRYALQQIITSKSALYEAELAKMVESHFEEMLMQLREKNVQEDNFDEAALAAELDAALGLIAGDDGTLLTSLAAY